MNKTKIDWPWKNLYTWNPVTGCLHNCWYCYARKIAMRFDKHFDPCLHFDRLKEPKQHKKPRNIFVGSMTDLFGDFIRDGWVNMVLSACREAPQHTYIFLTKNPYSYHKYDFRGLKVWLGTTITGEKMGDWKKQIVDYGVNEIGTIKRFISAEPLLGDFTTGNMIPCYFDLVIVGALTGPGSKPPAAALVESIKHEGNNIYYKKSMGDKYVRLNKKGLT